MMLDSTFSDMRAGVPEAASTENPDRPLPPRRGLRCSGVWCLSDSREFRSRSLTTTSCCGDAQCADAGYRGRHPVDYSEGVLRRRAILGRTNTISAPGRVCCFTRPKPDALGLLRRA